MVPGTTTDLSHLSHHHVCALHYLLYIPQLGAINLIYFSCSTGWLGAVVRIIVPEPEFQRDYAIGLLDLYLS